MKLLHLVGDSPEDVGVQTAAQPLVAGHQNDAGLLHLLTLLHERVDVLGVGVGQVRRDVADLLCVGPGLPHPVLCLAHFRYRDHFHGLCDLLRVLDALDLVSDLFAACHSGETRWRAACAARGSARRLGDEDVLQNAPFCLKSFRTSCILASTSLLNAFTGGVVC